MALRTGPNDDTFLTPHVEQAGVTRRGMLGSAIAAGSVAMLPGEVAGAPVERTVDVLLVGGGIMSATLGVLLRQLEPSWTIRVGAYGKAAVGSPPMSVPHLDTRYLDVKQVLLFGPFATFSTKFLKQGSYFDLPASVTLDNFRPMVAVGWDDFDLVEYLGGQLIMSDADRMTALREYLPGAKDGDWRLSQAGQRVQIIKRDPKKGGVLALGTEIVASKDGSIAALLGASPGASTAPSIMLDLLKKVFPAKLATPEWQAKIREIVPSYGVALNDDTHRLAQTWASTAMTLQLATAPPAITVPTTPPARRDAGQGRSPPRLGVARYGVGARASRRRYSDSARP